MLARMSALALGVFLAGSGLAAPTGARASGQEGSLLGSPLPRSPIAPPPAGICPGEPTLLGAPSPHHLECAGQPPAAHGSEPTSVPGDWSIVASPNARAAFPRSVLHEVTCVSASDCWAVGYTFTGSAYHSLTEHWDGSEWTVVPSAYTDEIEANILYDVECLSATNCWAVGHSASGTATRTLIQRWDGTSWAIVPSPNVSALDYLRDVTCLSPSDCWTVGYTYSGLNGASEALVQHWDGALWEIVDSPNPDVTRGSSLANITCTSVSSCWAVGGAAGATLIQRWDGTSWSIVPSPNNSTYESNTLSSVTCSSNAECWAVGLSVTDNEWRTLIERWNGTSWTIVSSPNISLFMNYLDEVTCISADDCWAVGGYTAGAKWLTFAQRWDGNSWKTVDAPSTDQPGGNFIYGLSCASAKDCWMVGSAWTSNAIYTVSLRWHAEEDGDEPSWHMVTSPNTFGHNANVLSSVTCASTTDCWAVGHYSPEPNSVTQTLIEHWDGTAWSVVASPNVGLSSNVLTDVTCVSGSDCWAVGYYSGDSGFRTLIEHWDGDTWNVVPSAHASSFSHFLYGVDCTSATDCWAVGNHHRGSLATTLIERWDGSTWTIVASPNPSSQTVGARQRNVLSDVTCVSASDCWAVGSYDVDSPVQPDDLLKQKSSRTLIQRWNGTSWTTVPSPDTAAVEQHALTRVTCVSASDCWAVGSSYNALSPQGFFGAQEVAGTARQTLIKHWDGSTWGVVSSPNSSATQLNVLSGIACLSASDCWAVGSQDVNGTTQTLIHRWGGTAWTAVSSPNTSTAEGNVLAGMTCASSTCWAVGSSHNGVTQRTLTARYS